jgi:hypothetical protein
LIRRTRSQRQRLSATQAGTRRWPVDHIDAKRNLRQPCQHSQFLAAPPCNFPKSSLQHPQSLPAPCGRENFFQVIETIRRFTGEIGLALPAFCENLPANRKLQGDPGRETVLLLTASSATQSGLCETPDGFGCHSRAQRNEGRSARRACPYCGENPVPREVDGELEPRPGIRDRKIGGLLARAARAYHITVETQVNPIEARPSAGPHYAISERSGIGF